MGDATMDRDAAPGRDDTGRTPSAGAGRGCLARIAIGVLLLALALFAFLGFLVGTTAGGRMVLSGAERFLPDSVEAEIGTFDGRLIGRFELADVTVRAEGIEAHADRIAVSWRGTGLVRGKVHVNRARVEGLDVRIAERGDADSVSTGADARDEPPPGPPLADLPVELSFDSLLLVDASVTLPDSVRLTAASAVLTGRPDAYAVEAAAHVELPDLAAGDARLTGSGSTSSAELDSLRVETLGGHAAVTGSVTWWPDVTWDVRLDAEGIQPSQLALLPDPEQWPGEVALRGSTTGSRPPGGTLEASATIDTVHGTLRGEAVDGRFEVHVRGPRLELPAARIAWGPARVEASGSVGETLDLVFEAQVPDLGLVRPGATGTLAAAGTATGPRDTPRLQGTVQADGLEIDGTSAASVSGEVDLDLAGPLGADLVARELTFSGHEVDSLSVRLAGRRSEHRLEVIATGPEGRLDLAAAGTLDANEAWKGTLERLELTADTVGTWTLEAPVELALRTGEPASIRIGSACLVSEPSARICAEGERTPDGLRLDATVDALRLERFAVLMPDGYAVEAGVDAAIDIEQSAGGAYTGTIELHTTAGSLRVPGEDGSGRSFRYEPITLEIASAEEGSRARVEAFLSDSMGARLLAVTGSAESPFAFRQPLDLEALRGQPWSADVELAVDDLSVLAAAALPRWDAWGSLRASLQVAADADGRLEGSLVAMTDSATMRNTVRQNAWLLTLDPARLEARVGPEGLDATLDLVVGSGRTRLLELDGELRLPRFTALDIVPEEQPVDGTVSIRVDDLYFVEAFLPQLTDIAGRFALDSRIGGTLAGVEVLGDAQLEDGHARVPLLGLDLQDIQFAASGDPEGGIEIEGQVRSGEGLLTLTGTSERYPSAQEPTVIRVRGERFTVVDAPELNVVAEPELDLAFDGSTMRLTGEVLIPHARIGVPDVPEAAVTPSEDVIIVGDTAAQRDPVVPLEVDLDLQLGDDVFFSGFGFSANLAGALNVTQAAGGEPRGRGEIRFVNGTFRQLGQELRIDPGRLLFNGPIDDPAVDARAYVRASDGTEAGFRVGGTVQQLDVTTYSNPPRSDSDIMSYILFGRPMSQTSGAEGNQASNAAALLGANMLAMSLAPTIGLDEARVETGTQQNKAQLVVGKYLTPRLYVGYGIGLYEPISTLRLRYLLTARWAVEAITGDQQSADLLWRIERGGPGDRPEETDAEPGAEPGGEPAAEPGAEPGADPGAGPAEEPAAEPAEGPGDAAERSASRTGML